MKKTLLVLGITWMAFSSCSKKDDPEKQSKFFFFDIKYGSKQLVEYGHIEYNNELKANIYGGPKYSSSQQNDQMVLSVWPDYTGPYFLTPKTEPIIFSKKGTDITGDYYIKDQVTRHFMIQPPTDWATYFYIMPGTEKLTITKTGDSNEGKFAEGTMVFNARVTGDSIPVPATATFRLKME